MVCALHYIKYRVIRIHVDQIVSVIIANFLSKFTERRSMSLFKRISDWIDNSFLMPANVEVLFLQKFRFYATYLNAIFDLFAHGIPVTVGCSVINVSKNQIFFFFCILWTFKVSWIFNMQKKTHHIKSDKLLNALTNNEN